MQSLGKKLAAAQSVAGKEHANTEQMASALRALAKEASNSAKTLDETTFTSEELSRIASDASSASLSLAEAAVHIAIAAERMKGTDSARNATKTIGSLADAAASAKELTNATQKLSAPIESLNTAMTTAQHLCKK
jgi:methyl-accepting chemotaxis protein